MSNSMRPSLRAARSVPARKRPSVSRGARAEEARVEEVGREAAGLRLEFAEAKDVRIKGELDELLLDGLHG